MTSTVLTTALWVMALFLAGFGIALIIGGMIRYRDRQIPTDSEDEQR